VRQQPNVRRAMKVLQGGTPRRHLLAVLLEDLYAAVDWKTDRSSATVAVVQRTASGDFYITRRRLTVWNPFENISLDSGTLIKIEWIEGEWQPYAADCIAGSDSVPSAGGSAVDSLLENQPPGFPSPP